ncbi:c-type cytochrome [Mucilaginibacter gotjawali]|uniref:Cytochrome c domain-containing protein n=1 Tax=Mucilaginibacter gotjawali TaxID=1550579 RepID=A0A839SJW6_9SPHI|nr:c-type cytochrome [Mucilaginibacter gotjawali]MBB3057170.1 hypothetical protein [Mucilaginibacter gotjawali]
MRKALIMITITVAVLYSCTHDRVVPYKTSSGPIAKGDTVCFQSDVLPLFQTYCASTGCHDGKNNGEDRILNLTTYSNIMQGIVPFNTGPSRYYSVIQDGSMPPGNSPKLTPAQTATIAKWIDQGALNTSCATATCDTTKTTYSNGVSQIFSTYCNGCHGVAPGSGNVILSDYASAKSAGTSLKASFLAGINYTSALPAMNMPPSGPLSSCQVKQITKWINNGCPQ